MAELLAQSPLVLETAVLIDLACILDKALSQIFVIGAERLMQKPPIGETLQKFLICYILTYSSSAYLAAAAVRAICIRAGGGIPLPRPATAAPL